MDAICKPPRYIKRKIYRAAQQGVTLTVEDCLPKPKEPTQLERIFQLLNNYFEVVRITDLIETSNGRKKLDAGQEKVIEYCRNELLFAKYNIQCKQLRLAKWRLTNITNKLDENNMVNTNLLQKLRSIQ